MNLSETIPIISASQYYIGNDTGWGHISFWSRFKVFIFIYGFSSFWLMVFIVKIFHIIVPRWMKRQKVQDTILEAKIKISVDKVLQ